MWMLYDGKHAYLDYDLGLITFSSFFLDWIYHVFSLSSPIHAASNQLSPFYPTSVICWSLALPLCSETARFADFFTWQTQFTLFFKNRNIFDSRLQCLWMHQNIMALKGSYTVQRSNRPKWNCYRGALFANTTKLSNFLSFLWHLMLGAEGGRGGKGKTEIAPLYQI